MSKLDKEDFIQGVRDIVRSIPYGRATSYGAIAKAVGYPNMSRMVGKMMGECSSGSDIPAHRVVNSQGCLSGSLAFGNSGEMQRLLELEGIIVVNNRIKDWQSVFWSPIEEIFLD